MTDMATEPQQAPIDAAEIIKRWTEADRPLREARTDHWLNLSFYLGEQWVWRNRGRGTIERLPQSTSENDRVRVTINKVKPRTTGLMGRLTKRNLTFEVPPTAVDDSAVSGAHLAEQILEEARREQDWETVREDELFSVLVGGTCAVVVDWNRDAGTEITLDPSTGQVMMTGDPVLRYYTLPEFTLEPGSRSAQDARWMICAVALPPEQAQDRYHLDWLPEADAFADATTPLMRSYGYEDGADQRPPLTVVYTMWERPHGGMPGRIPVVINNKIVEQGEWRYPFEHLPAYIFRQAKVPGRWWGDTFLNAARPVQVAYNAVRSNILEHAKLAGSARLMVPWGSLADDQALTDEAGEIVQYTPDGSGAAPHWLEPPQLSRYLSQEADRLEAELDDIMHTHATSRGEAPGDRNSGLALSLLAEKDDTPLGLMARDQSNGWGSIATMVLGLYEAYTQGERETVVSTQGVPTKARWTAEQLNGQTQAMVPLDQTMPHSQTATRAMLTDLAQTFPQAFQTVSQPLLFRMLDMPNAAQLDKVLDDDVAKAVWENTVMRQGEICLPEPWHDHAQHIAEHNRERNAEWFAFTDDERRSVFADHIAAHEQMIADEIAHQQTMNALEPGLAAMPQGDEPVGSLVPRDHVDAATPPPGVMPAGPRPPGL